MSKPNSYLLHKGMIDGESYLIIATMQSNNSKTGDMIQICILLEDTDPVAGVLSGLDAQTICQGCPFASGEGCYVNVGQSPLSIWRAYHRGNVPYLRAKDYTFHFAGRKVRFGSYGNPTLIPLRIVQRISSICDGWTGYFHNWRELGKKQARIWNRFFMASTETTESLQKAKKWGLRVFHASPVKPDGLLECVADSHGIECKDCLLCEGGKNAKDIWINPHGSKKNKAIVAATK